MPLQFKEKKYVEKLAKKAKKMDVSIRQFIFQYKKTKLSRAEFLLVCSLALGLPHSEGVEFVNLSPGGLTKAKRRLAKKLDIDIYNVADLAVNSLCLCLNGEFIS